MPNNPCDPAQPFVKLGNGSNAPTLDYNLPQETCYDVYLPFKVSIPPEFFKEECFMVPEDNLWEKIQGMSLQTLIAELKEDLMMERYTYGSSQNPPIPDGIDPILWNNIFMGLGIIVN